MNATPNHSKDPTAVTLVHPLMSKVFISDVENHQVNFKL